MSKKHPITGIQFPPAPAAGTFHSPWTTGPDNCPDIQSRNGQTFELVEEVWDPEVREEESLPLAKVRFPDGLEVLAWPEEIGWAVSPDGMGPARI